MAKRATRVLIDLSVAARGYCGMAQDVRLLYKALASCPEFDVTGLLYLPRRLRPSHRFLPASAPRGARLANQACFLWEFDGASGSWPPVDWLRRLKHFRELAMTAWGPKVQLDRLDVEVFWDAVWRFFFSPTLAAEDLPLVQNGKFLLANLSDGMFQARTLLRRRPIKLDTRGYDFLIVQDPRPLRIDPQTCQIVRYHDLIPLVRPDTMRNPWYIKWHHRAISQRANRRMFVCNSEPTREDLTAAYPELVDTSTTIPNMLSQTYFPDPCPDAVERILDRRRSAIASSAAPGIGPRPRYLLSVSTLEPRKNFTGLIQAFNMLKWRAGSSGTLGELKLVIVGSPGWKYEPILAAMRGLIERGEMVHLEKVPAEEMRVLYTHAEAFVFPSNYEGFGFPPLEAMQCGAPVIASDIATHRWVLGDAALYCSPYDPASIAAAIERLVASDESAPLRQQCVSRGYLRVQRYHVDRCAAEWRDLLHRLQENPNLRGSFRNLHPAERCLPSSPTRVPAELPH